MPLRRGPLPLPFHELLVGAMDSKPHRLNDPVGLEEALSRERGRLCDSLYAIFSRPSARKTLCAAPDLE